MTGSSSLSARITWRSLQVGAWRMIAPGFASVPFGIGFGVAASQKGLSGLRDHVDEFHRNGGTSQMVALDLWAHPLP